MSIIASYRRSVKSIMHPDARPVRTPRLFAEGLEPEQVETIPATVERIRITSGDIAGVYTLSTAGDDSGCNRWWKAESRPRHELTNGTVDRLYRRGEVEILKDGAVAVEAPASSPAPVVEAPARPIRLARGETQVWDDARQTWVYRRAILAPSLPTADEVWNLARGLGRDGADAAPLSDWPADLKAAFLDGLAWGQEQLDADRQDDADAYHEVCEAENREAFEEAMAVEKYRD